MLITYSIVGVVQIWWKILACWTEETPGDFTVLRALGWPLKWVTAKKRFGNPNPCRGIIFYGQNIKSIAQLSF